MITEVLDIVHYFKCPSNYFWRWAENGNVIEWQNGTTICYLEDVSTIMKASGDNGLPSFAALLLVVAACNDNWSSSSDLRGILHGLKSTIGKDESSQENYYLDQAIQCMDMIASLPKELRQGAKRTHLVHELFRNCSPALSGEMTRTAVDQLLSRRLDNFILANKEQVKWEDYKKDLGYLTQVFQNYFSVTSLENSLRTGIIQLPAPLPIDLPASKQGTLLEELATEQQTTGIALLAKRIIAALNIPMHTQGSSDQFFGGVSDITNRGGFDKLLLSELAYDDATLMARLANNESLYLRRETPPENPKNKRVVLVDTTLKMWGLPRVFALSAAIACILNSKHHEEIVTFLLSGEETIETDLTSVEKVKKGLEIMSPSLNCFPALSQYFSATTKNENTDCIFISLHETIHDFQFQKIIAENPESLSFILSIDRDGGLHFNELVHGRIKLLTKAKFDLDNLLFSPKQVQNKDPDLHGFPAFFKQSTAPLLFPSTGTRLSAQNSFYSKKLGVLLVTDSLRLLYWPSRGKAARELMSRIEPGTYTFGQVDDDLICLLVNNTKSAAVYFYSVNSAGHTEEKILEASHPGISDVRFRDNCFYIGFGPGEMIDKIDCLSASILAQKSEASYLFRSPKIQQLTFNPGNMKRHINNGYNVLHRLTTVGISRDDMLGFDKKVFSNPEKMAKHFHFLAWMTGLRHTAQKLEDQISIPGIEDGNLTIFRWADGSKMMIDSRGLLHLVSSDQSLPEISIVLIQNKTTTCWASDGVVSGNDYFIPPEATNIIAPGAFYNKYIEPIIKKICAA